MEVAPEEEKWYVGKVVEGDRIADGQGMVHREQRAIHRVCQKLAALNIRISGRDVEQWMAQAKVVLSGGDALRLFRSRHVIHRNLQMWVALSSCMHHAGQEISDLSLIHI